jgi:PhnB protein
MPQPIAHLAFNGNCADAMRFYERALGGTLEVMLRTADSPMAAEVPPEFGDRIMHACLALDGNGYLYAATALRTSRMRASRAWRSRSITTP